MALDRTEGVGFEKGRRAGEKGKKVVHGCRGGICVALGLHALDDLSPLRLARRRHSDDGLEKGDVGAVVPEGLARGCHLGSILVVRDGRWEVAMGK